MPEQPSVFISYSGSPDSARRIASSIAACGYAPWFDHRLRGGQPWWDQILEEIRACHVFVFAISPRSAESVPCHFELGYALDVRRPILPVLAEPVAEGRLLPEPLMPIQWVDISDDDPNNASRLREALEAMDAVSLPEKLPKPPILPNLGRRRVTFPDLEATHARLEALVGIYSVVAWRSERQKPPLIKEGNQLEGTDEFFRLECNKIAWGAQSNNAELFSCFVEEVVKSFEGEEFPAPRLTPNEDFYYRFEWESLFGTPLNVEVSPQGASSLYELRDQLAEDGKTEPGDDPRPFTIYVVGIDGFPVSDSVEFLAAEGYFEWLQDGNVWPIDGWVVYLHGDKRLSLEEIECTIYRAAPASPPADGLEQAVHSIAKAWSARDPDYLQRLVGMNDLLQEMFGEGAS